MLARVLGWVKPACRRASVGRSRQASSAASSSVGPRHHNSPLTCRPFQPTSASSSASPPCTTPRSDHSGWPSRCNAMCCDQQPCSKRSALPCRPSTAMSQPMQTPSPAQSTDSVCCVTAPLKTIASCGNHSSTAPLAADKRTDCVARRPAARYHLPAPGVVNSACACGATVSDTSNSSPPAIPPGGCSINSCAMSGPSGYKAFCTRNGPACASCANTLRSPRRSTPKCRRACHAGRRANTGSHAPRRRSGKGSGADIRPAAGHNR